MAFLYVSHVSVPPKPCLRLNRLAAGASSGGAGGGGNDMSFPKGIVLDKHMFLYISCFYPFMKTPNRRGTQRTKNGGWDFVLSSHLDPIGDQNDVQYLSRYCMILCILGVCAYI